MNLEQEVKKLRKELDDMRLAKDMQFVESARKRIFQGLITAGVIDTSLAPVNETTIVTIGAGGGSDNVTHAEAYDRKARITINGVDYYIGLYDT